MTRVAELENASAGYKPKADFAIQSMQEYIRSTSLAITFIY
jgi:hypothetical protein